MRVYYGKKGQYVQGEFTGWKDQLFMGLCACLERARTGSSSRSGGTATKCDALPMSMPATLGWVMVSAARDLPGFRLMLRLRWAMACSIIRRGMWRRIGYVVLLTLSNGISAQRLRTVKSIHQCR